MKILGYGTLRFSYGIHGREIVMRGWKLDFEGKTMQGATEVILETIKALLEDTETHRTQMDNNFVTNKNKEKVGEGNK